jgi:hypothetical protein
MFSSMRNPFSRALSITVAAAYVATLAACGSAQQTPQVVGAAPAAIAHSTGVGKLEISRSGSGLMVRLINPKDGTATANSSYQKDKADCYKLGTPCYVFSAVNGTAPMPVSASDCEIDHSSDLPTAYCKAPGVSSVTIDAQTGGTIGYDASGAGELGKHCFPASLIYEVGDKDVYSVLAWDGCPEKIHCAGKNYGTVDADHKDVIEGPCYLVHRH